MRHSQKRRSYDTALAVDSASAYDKLLRIAISSTSHPDRQKLLGHLRARQYNRLLEWADRPSPQLYGTSSSYYEDCQLSALIRKYPFTSSEVPGIDPEGVAVRKFASAEHKCKWVNRKFAARRKRWDSRAQIYAWVRKYIERAIGFQPPLEVIYGKCDITSGASLGIHGNKTNIARKVFASSWTCTPEALQYAIPALWAHAQVRDCILPGAIKCYDPVEFVRLVREKVSFVNYNKISFVPKTAKTHRSIAVEPFLNGFVQKGTDQHLRDCLQRVGIDLSDQTTNQQLAKLGSRQSFNPYVTIDLAAASDSLASEVVKSCLPPEWYEFLSELRATHYMLPDNSVHQYEKFCSMGNGFCFPLQTLIFASVCHAAARFTGDDDDFSVYGDDIIVRQNTALLVVEILRDMGFRTNVDKTFITGPFRESCGADWYEGQDVRPVHLAERLTDVRQLFALHNSCLRSHRTELFTEQLREGIRSIGGKDFLRPGRESGDTCYSVPLDLAMSSPYVSWRQDQQQWQWKEIKSSPVADVIRLDEVGYANILMMAVLRGAKPNNAFTLRRTTETKVTKISRPWYGGYNQSEPPVFQKSFWLTGRPTVNDVRKAANTR